MVFKIGEYVKIKRLGEYKRWFSNYKQFENQIVKIEGKVGEDIHKQHILDINPKHSKNLTYWVSFINEEFVRNIGQYHIWIEEENIEELTDEEYGKLLSKKIEESVIERQTCDTFTVTPSPIIHYSDVNIHKYDIFIRNAAC